MEVEAWTPGQDHTVSFSPGLWDAQGLSAECTVGSITGIKVHHPSPADCKEGSRCRLALLNKSLTSRLE